MGLLLATALPSGAAGLVDPLLRFRQIRTAHFVIYFHADEERLADRLASIVEGVRERVAASLDSPAPRLTHVILADQSEVANGWASPLPRNTIFLNAAAPSGARAAAKSSRAILSSGDQVEHELESRPGSAGIVRLCCTSVGAATEAEYPCHYG